MLIHWFDYYLYLWLDMVVKRTLLSMRSYCLAQIYTKLLMACVYRGICAIPTKWYTNYFIFYDKYIDDELKDCNLDYKSYGIKIDMKPTFFR